MGENGYLAFQEGGNPHKQYVENFANNGPLEDSASTISGTDQSGVISQVSSTFLSLPLVGDLTKFLFADALTLANSPLPQFLKLLLGGIINAVKFTAIISVLRGVNV